MYTNTLKAKKMDAMIVDKDVLKREEDLQFIISYEISNTLSKSMQGMSEMIMQSIVEGINGKYRK